VLIQGGIDTDNGESDKKERRKAIALRPEVELVVSVQAALLSGAVFFAFFFCFSANSRATAFCTLSGSIR
jgi:hypothetical protein